MEGGKKRWYQMMRKTSSGEEEPYYPLRLRRLSSQDVPYYNAILRPLDDSIPSKQRVQKKSRQSVSQSLSPSESPPFKKSMVRSLEFKIQDDSSSTAAESEEQTTMPPSTFADQDSIPIENIIGPGCIPYEFSLSEKSKSEASTVQFKGLDVKSDVVPTLQKIWSKHGDIVESSMLCNGDIVARALESLATAVLILEDNSVGSLNDDQADYLSSTLFDLRCLHFKVDWLVPSVEMALALYKSKPLVDYQKKLAQRKGKAADLKSKLVDDIAKLEIEEKELEEEIARVSKNILFSEQMDFDKPLGVGLT